MARDRVHPVKTVQSLPSRLLMYVYGSSIFFLQAEAVRARPGAVNHRSCDTGS